MTRRHFRTVVLMAVLQCLACAQSGGVISGSVVDSQTGQGLSRSRVTIQGVNSPPDAMQAVETDASGQFTIQGVPNGQYYLEAGRPGYIADAQFAQAQVSLPLTAAHAAKPAPPVLLKLQKQGVISGTLREEHGWPLPYAEVVGIRQVVRQGRRLREVIGVARSDADGEFRLTKLPPGLYYILTRPTAARAGRAYAPSFYPGSADIAGAQALELAAGDQRQIEFRLSSTTGVRVRGRALSASRLTVVSLTSTAEFGANSQNYQWDGDSSTFEVGDVVPGTYRLTITSAASTVQLGASRVITVGRTDIENLTIPLSAQTTIPVAVRVERTQAPSALARRSLGTPSFFLMLDRVLSTDRYTANCQPVSEDHFECAGVLPGETYRLNTGSSQSPFLRTATYDGKDVTTNSFLVSGAGGSLELVFSDRTATLTGALPVPSAIPLHVLALRKRGDEYERAGEAMLMGAGEGIQMRRSASGTPPVPPGHFRVEGLAPGEYLVLAIAAPEAVPYLEPDFLRDHDAYLQSVTILEGQQIDIMLKPPLLLTP